jgi:molybdopterin-guanine dinucleotide biosynthesis protein A
MAEGYKLNLENPFVTNNLRDFRFLGLNIIHDFYPGKGPFDGIHSGLIASSYENGVCQL